MTNKTNSGKSYHFYNMGDKPLAHDVLVKNTVKIPAGTTGVRIAFRQSPFTYIDPDTGKRTHLNVYLHKGQLIHA